MGEVIHTAGARAAEAQLLAAIERELGFAASGLDLARPVRVVVPSISLRLHVSARLVAARGRAAVGLRLQTLDSVAREVLDRAGVVLADPAPFPILVRREARREPALADGLEPLANGYGAVVAAVDDLLDAGFEAAHAEALDEQLVSQPGPRAAIARARALVRVAARVAARIAAGDASHRSRPLVRARELLERDPGLLPARALLVHGFADATGVQTDLLALLLRLEGARLLLDAPPDPTASVPRAGPRFGAVFRERVAEGRSARDRGEDGVAAPRARVRLVAAPARGAEVRAVALRLRSLLDAGAVPERLAVVARDLAPYRVALRVHLRRLGVPFSGVSEPGAAEPARRRLNALLALIEPGDRPAMEPWTTARLGVSEAGRADLRHAFHRRGALRLDEVARTAGAMPAEAVELATRRRLLPPEDGRPARATRRVVAAEVLVGAGRAAAALLLRLAARPGRAAVARQSAWLASLVGEDLGWTPATPERAALDAALASLPAAVELEHDEFLWLLRRSLESKGVSPIGGAGGGVQLLSVMEARARSFDALFVLGMSRGVFPRTIREDALLPDAVRARLCEVLPALPVKRDGFDEERFLFAQLVSAAPEVTLSWCETSDAGRPQPRSPLLEALARGADVTHEAAPPLHAPGQGVRALPGRERALLAGLHGSRRAFAEAFTSALEEQGVGAAAELTASRLAVLDELDPPLARGSALGPYFGFVGEIADPADPRRAPLFVTRLEDAARCPWQTFLSRVLRLAPPPDAAHELPRATDPRLIGNVVHRVLERIAHREGVDPDAGSGLDPLRRDPVPMPWPDEAMLTGWTAAAAEAELRDAASALPGYARVLARRARPFLERARQCDWCAAPPPVVGTEVQSSARVRDAAGREREIGFRADRVDRVLGRLILTDYKTGRPFADQKGAAARDNAFLREIAGGRALQALVYARAGGKDAVGRYLFLKEGLHDDARILAAADQAPFTAAFDAALCTLLEVWDRGAFVPRLRRADRDEEPGACRFCEVKDACLRGDSGARRRLERWLERAREADSDPERAAAAGLAIGVETP